MHGDRRSDSILLLGRSFVRQLGLIRFACEVGVHELDVSLVGVLRSHFAQAVRDITQLLDHLERADILKEQASSGVVLLLADLVGCHKAKITHIEATSVAYLLGVEQRGFNVAFALGLEHIHAESAMPVELLHQLEW